VYILDEQDLGDVLKVVSSPLLQLLAGLIGLLAVLVPETSCWVGRTRGDWGLGQLSRKEERQLADDSLRIIGQVMTYSCTGEFKAWLGWLGRLRGWFCWEGGHGGNRQDGGHMSDVSIGM